RRIGRPDRVRSLPPRWLSVSKAVPGGLRLRRQAPEGGRGAPGPHLQGLEYPRELRPRVPVPGFAGRLPPEADAEAEGMQEVAPGAQFQIVRLIQLRIQLLEVGFPSQGIDL